MPLVTTCPHCGTSFRIVADQLKLRGGLVRCGSCLAVFSGLEKMTRVDDASVHGAAGAWDDDDPLPGRTERGPRLPDLPPPDEIPSFGIPAADDLTSFGTPADDDVSPHISASDRAAFERAKLERAKLERARRDRDDRAAADRDLAAREASADTRATAMEPGPGESEADPEAAATARTAGGAERPEIVAQHTAGDSELAALGDDDDDDDEVAIGDEEMAIDYFSADERRRGFVGQHAFLKLATAGVLVLALIVQAVLANRDWLAARLPAFEPAIAAISAPFGLAIAPPRTITALSIESFELQTDAASDLLAVSAIIQNAARHPVRWPSMMLTLTDMQNRVLVRKAIDPADYLNASNDVALRPNSERPIRLALEARDLRPAGYSVVLFYR